MNIILENKVDDEVKEDYASRQETLIASHLVFHKIIAPQENNTSRVFRCHEQN